MLTIVEEDDALQLSMAKYKIGLTVLLNTEELILE